MKRPALLFCLFFFLLESCGTKDYIPLYKTLDDETNSSIWSDDPMTIYFSRNTASNSRLYVNHHDLYVGNRYAFMVEARYTLGEPFLIKYKGVPMQVVTPRQCALNNTCNNSPIPRLAPSRTEPTFTVQWVPTCTHIYAGYPHFSKVINFAGGACTTANAPRNATATSANAGSTILVTISIPDEPVAPRNGHFFDFEVTGTPIGAKSPQTVNVRAVFVDEECTATIALIPSTGPEGVPTSGTATFSATNAKSVTIRDATSRAALYDAVLPAGTSSVNSTVSFTVDGRPGSYPFIIDVENLTKKNCVGMSTFTVTRQPNPPRCSDCAGCPTSCADCPDCIVEPDLPATCPDGQQLFCADLYFSSGGAGNFIYNSSVNDCAISWESFAVHLRGLHPNTIVDVRRVSPCPRL